jgi:hypothetical protein
MTVMTIGFRQYFKTTAKIDSQINDRCRRREMVVLTATCKNGLIQLDQRLPDDLEGKQIQVMVQEVLPIVRKRRQAGSAAGQIWIAPDFDAPLDDFQEYM